MLTARQEKFAQEWFATGNKSEAYRRAYSAENMQESTINEKASRLSSTDKVRTRYDELRLASQKRSETTVDVADNMLRAAWKMAKDNQKPTAMVQATMGLIKLHGLDAETQFRLTNGFEDIADPVTEITFVTVDGRVKKRNEDRTVDEG